VYLHYVLDLWVQKWRKSAARGEVIIVRYADDFVMGLQHEDDAVRFLTDLRHRLDRFGLEMHPEKTRLLRFGRFAEERRRERGEGKPETFDFLGLTHICGRTRSGGFMLIRRTSTKRMRAKLKVIRDDLIRRRHLPVSEQGERIAAVVRRARLLRLPRRPHEPPPAQWLPNGGAARLAPCVATQGPARCADVGAHEQAGPEVDPDAASPASLPGAALRRSNPRWEPSAVVPLARICAGGGPSREAKGRPYRDHRRDVLRARRDPRAPPDMANTG
jgi:hypothetical protein